MMATTSFRRRTGQAEVRASLAVAVADSNWFTTENLFREVQRDGVSTLLLNCMDVRNAWRRGSPPWRWRSPLVRRGDRLWQHNLVLPSGWMKQYPRLGMRPIARSVRRWRTAEVPGGRLALVMTYPYYLYLRDMIAPDHYIYYNIDDYSLYWPRHAEQIRELEQRAAKESDLTVCVSRLRAEALRMAVPEAAHKIHHLAHGDCLARPNVHVLGWRPQEAIHLYNRGFDVCLIPYATDHPFNRACCPTKIMDYMGSGRPIVSTDLPECRLHDGLFHVASGVDAFIDDVRAILAAGSDDGRADRRFQWARDHSCRCVADRILDWLPE